MPDDRVTRDAGSWSGDGGRQVPTAAGEVRYSNLRSLVEAVSTAPVLDAGPPYDVVVVGGGPAGLAVAVCSAAAGLATLILERAALGGQAAEHSGMEAHLDFPSRAAADRGCPPQVAVGLNVAGLSASGQLHAIATGAGKDILARAVVAATGGRYRRLNVPGCDRYEGRGLHYVATGMEAAVCAGEEVVIVGAGPSACQAAAFLGGVARHVHLLIPGESLEAEVSDYLAARVRQSPSITINSFTEVVELGGARGLDQVTVRNTASGACKTSRVRHLFVLIGAVPNTAWLGEHLALDAKGFIRNDIYEPAPHRRFETSCAGVFAVGDVRAGSAGTIAAAVADGFEAGPVIEAYLANLGRAGA